MKSGDLVMADRRSFLWDEGVNNTIGRLEKTEFCFVVTANEGNSYIEIVAQGGRVGWIYKKFLLPAEWVES